LNFQLQLTNAISLFCNRIQVFCELCRKNEAVIASKLLYRPYCLLFDSQDHYDFGMRAVKTVISAAGNIKREYPDMNEVLLVNKMYM